MVETAVEEEVDEELRHAVEELLKKELRLKRVPLSVEIRIIDDSSGRVIFHWRRGRGNLLLGLEKAFEVLETKVGIPVRKLLLSQTR
ncbi:MAG: hypothetical protein ACXQT6_01320 [Candidatus Methanospirareceae archaeon]